MASAYLGNYTPSIDVVMIGKGLMAEVPAGERLPAENAPASPNFSVA